MNGNLTVMSKRPPLARTISLLTISTRISKSHHICHELGHELGHEPGHEERHVGSTCLSLSSSLRIMASTSTLDRTTHSVWLCFAASITSIIIIIFFFNYGYAIVLLQSQKRIIRQTASA